MLLDALEHPRAYVPIDISGEYLRGDGGAAGRDYPDLAVQPVVADFTKPLVLPLFRANVRRSRFLPGLDARQFRPRARRSRSCAGRAACCAAAACLLGVDLVKDPALLHAAYNDARGRDRGLQHEPAAPRQCASSAPTSTSTGFAHYAFYNPPLRRIEMHLVSRARQHVTLDGQRFDFEEGETIHTENSHKFTIDGLPRARGAGGLHAAPDVV